MKQYEKVKLKLCKYRKKMFNQSCSLADLMVNNIYLNKRPKRAENTPGLHHGCNYHQGMKKCEENRFSKYA